MPVAIHGIRRALVVLTLCVIVSTGFPLAQSEPPSGSDSPFTVVPVMNAPFVAEAITTILPTSGGAQAATRTLRDRYYRDSSGRVRAERSTPRGDLVIIDADPGDSDTRVTFLNPDTETFLVAPITLAQVLFNSGTNITLPRDIFRHVMIGRSQPEPTTCDRCPAPSQTTGGGTSGAHEASPDLGLVVYSRRFHTRLGTVEFRLTNIRQLEPAPELFEVPTSYLPAPAGTRFELDPPEW